MSHPPGDDLHVEQASEADSISPSVLRHISSHAVFTLDTEGHIEAWPAPARRLYGYDASEIVGLEFGTLFAEAGSIPETAELLARARPGTHEIEHWNERADGSVFWAVMALSSCRTAEFQGYVVLSRDTTERKKYERTLERQNDRLEEFTDVVAHDLRNPLNVIDGRLELYRSTREEEHLEQIERTTNRMERLVDDLLRVARQGDLVTDPEPTDVEAVVETAWEGTGGPETDATLEYEPVPSVGAEHDRLCELFENLFRNAVQHGESAVTVRVGPFENGFYVEDSGPGIPSDVRGEVFDHGFTTKERGSGYGLSIVRTIANAHGWTVGATDRDGGGARFEITGVDFLD